MGHQKQKHESENDISSSKIALTADPYHWVPMETCLIEPYKANHVLDRILMALNYPQARLVRNRVPTI